jgi:hypothetical protein
VGVIGQLEKSDGWNKNRFDGKKKRTIGKPELPPKMLKSDEW